MEDEKCAEEAFLTKYYKANKAFVKKLKEEKEKEYQRKYREANKDKQKEHQKRYREARKNGSDIS